MSVPLWNMSAPLQHNPISHTFSSGFGMESNTKKLSSEAESNTLTNHDEIDDPIRKVWRFQYPTLPTLSNLPFHNQTMIPVLPKLNTNQVDIFNNDENANHPDNTVKREFTRFNFDGSLSQSPPSQTFNHLPLTIDPTVTQETRFWSGHGHKQSSDLSSSFTLNSSVMHARPQTSSSSDMEVSYSTPLTNIGNETNEFCSPPFKATSEIQTFNEALPRLPAMPYLTSIIPPTVRSDKPQNDTSQHSSQTHGSWYGKSNSSEDFCKVENKENSFSNNDPKNPGEHNLAPIFSQPLVSPPSLIQQKWHITSEIILRSTCGEKGQDVHYPTDPRAEDIWYSLQDPNAPTIPGHSAATTHHLQFYNYGPGQVPRNRVLPPPQILRSPSSLPYTSPSVESYYHVDPNKRPRRQDEKLRFPGDLYTPRWVRGDGIGREGWCSLCHTGSWMQLKTSQYWYHVRFTHGVNSNTGRIYDPPLQLRICDDSLGSTYGFCGECHDWVPICTPRRKRSFTAWFKHAHKCHRVKQFNQIIPIGDVFQQPSSIRNDFNNYSTNEASSTSQNVPSVQPKMEEFSPQISSLTSILSAPQTNETILAGTIVNRNSINQRASWPSAPSGFELPHSLNETFTNDHQTSNKDEQMNFNTSKNASNLLYNHSSGHRRSTSESWLLQNANANASLFSNRFADLNKKIFPITVDENDENSKKY